MTHRALIVAAVSTEKQAADDKASIPRQLEDCRKVCEARGWPVVAEVTIPGHSRNYYWLDELAADSPDYAELVRTIRADTVTLIICRDYDRLWRTDPLRAQVMALCRENGVQVYSLNQPVEPLTPERLKQGSSDSAMIMEALGGILAESENRTRVRRMVVGKEGVIRAGLSQYASYQPYGYIKIIGSNLIEVDAEQARWVRWIFERRVTDRWGYTKIARELNSLNVPSPRGQSTGWIGYTVRRILHNPIYRGTVRWGGATNENGQHEPIISDDTWHMAQVTKAAGDNFSDRPQKYGNRATRGLVFCGHCGWAMVNSGTRGIRCGKYTSTQGGQCQCNYHLVEPLESYIFKQVRKALNNPAEWLAERDAAAENETAVAQVEQINHEIAVLAARYARWNQAYEIGSITLDELMGHRSRIAAQTDELQRQRKAIDAGRSEQASRADNIRVLAESLAVLDSAEPETLNGIYRRLISRIVVERGKPPVIEWL